LPSAKISMSKCRCHYC